MPFSFGDIVYGAIFLWLIWKMGKGIKILYQKKATWSGLGNRLWKAVNVILAIYILFNAFWGINYKRKGIAHQLGISKEKYTANDIKQINEILVKK
ncbi:MAG: DUF3810 family protein [Chitinophagaceae bacterium]|nr:DUF3810 family protein [Chitinophagaceae bacterium]